MKKSWKKKLFTGYEEEMNFVNCLDTVKSSLEFSNKKKSPFFTKKTFLIPAISVCALAAIFFASYELINNSRKLEDKALAQQSYSFQSLYQSSSVNDKDFIFNPISGTTLSFHFNKDDAILKLNFTSTYELSSLEVEDNSNPLTLDESNMSYELDSKIKAHNIKWTLKTDITEYTDSFTISF